MKKFLTIFTTSVLFLQSSAVVPAFAAPTTVQLKSNFQLPLSGGEQISAVISDGANILIAGTTDSKTSSLVTGELQGNSDGFLSSLTETGQIQWTLRLGSKVDEIVTDLVEDNDGTYWVLGAASTLTTKTLNSPNTSGTVINPDNVVIDRSISSNSALNTVKIWQVSKTGSILNSFESIQSTLIEPKQLLIDSASLIIVGTIYSANKTSGFVMSSTKTGIFQPVIKVGATNTKLNSAAIDNSGNLVLVGSSGETIGKSKKISGRDAIALKTNSSVLAPVIARASLKNSERSWLHVSSDLFISGYVSYASKAKVKSEFAVTKFTSFGKPNWNFRFAAEKLGTSQSTKTSLWAAFTPTSSVVQLKGWQKRQQTGAILKFDAKGKILAGYQISGSPTVSTIADSNGLILISESGNSFNFFLLK